MIQKLGEIKEYESLTSVRKDGFCRENVFVVIKSNKKIENILYSHKGFYWKYLDDKYENFPPQVQTKKKYHYKPVKRINIITFETKIYSSTTEPVKEGFSQGHVVACCRGERKTHKGYYWQYLDKDKEENNTI